MTTLTADNLAVKIISKSRDGARVAIAVRSGKSSKTVHLCKVKGRLQCKLGFLWPEVERQLKGPTP